MSRIMRAIVILVIAGGLLNAQSGPSWLQMGNLDGAHEIFDILEIPNTNIVIAVGDISGFWGPYGGVWKSVDGGQTWTRVYGGGSTAFYGLNYDTLRNIIFVTGEAQYMIYSSNLGENWHIIYLPYFVGEWSNQTSVLVNGRLYVGGYTWMNDRYYSPVLLRLDYSDPDTNNWYWELINQYPELNDTAGIFQLVYKDNKLFVFGKDKGGNGIRIYTYDISTLDKMAKPIGTVAEMAEYWKKHKEELAENKRPNREVKEMPASAPSKYKK